MRAHLEVARGIASELSDGTAGLRRHVRCAPLSAAECAPALLKFGLAPGYLLHVGTIEPPQNLGMPAAERTPGLPGDA